MISKSFGDIARKAFQAAGIELLQQDRESIVLERFATGGGRTKWYRCIDRTSFEKLTEKVSPGSMVSFYFDGRIGRVDSSNIKIRALTLLKGAKQRADVEEVLVGYLAKDGLVIDMDYVHSERELDEWLASISDKATMFCGVFPEKGGDGQNFITVTLPDAVGSGRGYPY
jgi:hypothetical protein